MKAAIKVMGREYSAEGETVQEAIGNLVVPHGAARGAAVLSVDDQKIILAARQAQNLFNPSPAIREVHIKNISLRFS